MQQSQNVSITELFNNLCTSAQSATTFKLDYSKVLNLQLEQRRFNNNRLVNDIGTNQRDPLHIHQKSTRSKQSDTRRKSFSPNTFEKACEMMKKNKINSLFYGSILTETLSLHNLFAILLNSICLDFKPQNCLTRGSPIIKLVIRYWHSQTDNFRGRKNMTALDLPRW